MSSSHVTTGAVGRAVTAADAGDDNEDQSGADVDPTSQDSTPTDLQYQDQSGSGGGEGAGGGGGAGGENSPSADHDYSRDPSSGHDYSQDQSHEPVAGQDYTDPWQHDYSQDQSGHPPLAYTPADQGPKIYEDPPRMDTWTGEKSDPDPLGLDWRNELDKDLQHEDGEGLRGGRDVTPEIDTDFLYAP